MKQETVNSTLMHLSQSIPSMKMPMLKDRLERANESAFSLILAQKMLNNVVVMLLGFFLGMLGVDRFMTKDTGLGVLRLVLNIIGTVLIIFGVFSFGITALLGLLLYLGLYIWIIIDLCTATGRCREKNFDSIIMAINMAGDDHSSDTYL